MLDVGCEMLDVEFGMGHAAREYSPTDRRSIFSHAENLSMRARFNGYAPRGQKFIAQGKRSGALGIMCCVVCAL